MTRVLVCGGRWWNDQPRVNEVLDRLHAEHNFTVLIQGGQKNRHNSNGRTFYGADYQAKVWALKRGVPVIEEPANWAESPRHAGPIRNSKMLHEHKPDLGVAFKGGNGTADMVRKMKAASVPVLEFDHTEEEVPAQDVANMMGLPDPTTLADAIRQRNNWINTAAQQSRNADYYRGLIEQIGKALGPESFIADDGSISESVLCAKVPELVAARIAALRICRNFFAAVIKSGKAWSDACEKMMRDTK